MPVHLRIRRWAIWVLVALVAVMAVTGIWLAFEYEPDGGTMSAIHGIVGLLTVGAALAVAVTTALDEERSTAGVLPAVVVLAVVAGLYLTGPALRWDQMGARTGPDPGARGIVDAFDDDVELLTRGNEVIDAGDYRRIAWLHAVALPVALVVMGAAGIWAVRRRLRAYQPRHAAAVDEPSIR